MLKPVDYNTQQHANYASSQVLGKDGPARHLKTAGEAMIAAALAATPP